MRKIVLVINIIGLALIITVLGLFAYARVFLPKGGAAPTLVVEKTPEQIARGEYLVKHASDCLDCHSQRDPAYFSGPVMPGTEGGGGERFGEEAGVPGVLYAANITPDGIGRWTDGELLRAITVGIDRDGQPLYPMMPYLHYGKLAKSDALSIIAYIRTLKPIVNKVPKGKLDFPMNWVVRTIPERVTLPEVPPDAAKNSIANGEYLVNLVGCIECHSPVDHGQMMHGMEFSGGVEFTVQAGIVRSANLTPDEETGIGRWTKDQFVHKFKMYDPALSPPIKLAPGDFDSPMPWFAIAGLTEQDLGSIFDYLKSLKPIKHAVVARTKNNHP
jgi:mono/diheme cytochrome c family protein